MREGKRAEAISGGVSPGSVLAWLRWSLSGGGIVWVEVWLEPAEDGIDLGLAFGGEGRFAKKGVGEGRMEGLPDAEMAGEESMNLRRGMANARLDIE